MFKPGQALITYPAYTTTGTAVVTYGMMNISGDPGNPEVPGDVGTLFKCSLVGHDTGMIAFFNADTMPLNTPVTLNQTVTVTTPSYFYVAVDHLDEVSGWLRDDTIPFFIDTAQCTQCETLNQASCILPCSWWANNSASESCHSVDPTTWTPKTQCCGVPPSAYNNNESQCTFYQWYYWSDGTCNSTAEPIPPPPSPNGGSNLLLIVGLIAVGIGLPAILLMRKK